eukprot:gb/GECG01000754.1/.p1 GENE.gb/GECG01000754.1/~~gb/GECG01000754.1/.p1  ORF type:complete len:529 (+),score=57.45 gb/GECG01000754.1/:1-1587(+)
MEGPNGKGNAGAPVAQKHARTDEYQSGGSQGGLKNRTYSETAAPIYRYIWKTIAADNGSSRQTPRATRRSCLSLNIDRTASESSGALFSPSVRNRDMYINRAAVPSNELSLSDVFESLDLDDDRRIRVKEDLPVALRVLGLEWPMSFTDAYLRGGVEELERTIQTKQYGYLSEADYKSRIVRDQEISDPEDRVEEEGQRNGGHQSNEQETRVTGAANPPPPPPNLVEQNTDGCEHGHPRRSSEGNNLSRFRSDPAMKRHVNREKISFSTFCNIVNVLQRNGAARKRMHHWRNSTNSFGSSYFGSCRDMRDLAISAEEASVPRSVEKSLTSDSLSHSEEGHQRTLSHSGQIAHHQITPENGADQVTASNRNPERHKCPLGEVFLGGACNPTTWRKDIAMPLLDKHGVTYYNPQVENWTPDLIEVEANAKQEALILMFVVTGETRAVASMIEIAEHISSERDVVIVLQDVEPGSQISGHELYADEVKDLNRGRAYLADVADRRGVKVFQNITKAVEHVIARIKRLRREAA